MCCLNNSRVGLSAALAGNSFHCSIVRGMYDCLKAVVYCFANACILVSICDARVRLTPEMRILSVGTATIKLVYDLKQYNVRRMFVLRGGLGYPSQCHLSCL